MERLSTAEVAKSESTKNLEVLVAGPYNELLAQVTEAITVAIAKGAYMTEVKIPAQSQEQAIHESIRLVSAKLAELGYYTYTDYEYPTATTNSVTVYDSDNIYIPPKPLALKLFIDWNNPNRSTNNNRAFAKVPVASTRYW